MTVRLESATPKSLTVASDLKDGQMAVILPPHEHAGRVVQMYHNAWRGIPHLLLPIGLPSGNSIVNTKECHVNIPIRPLEPGEQITILEN